MIHYIGQIVLMLYISAIYFIIIQSKKWRLLNINIQRAQEIIDSPVMVTVTYQGAQIYIQNVDEHNEMARIYPLGQPENEQTVPLHSLNEK